MILNFIHFQLIKIVKNVLKLLIYDNFIEFYFGDSKETFTKFNKPAEFIWVDGGHDYNTALKDLENAERLKIKHICVDDVNYTPIKNAVNDFCKKYNYKIVKKSNDVRKDKKWKGAFYLTNDNL